jgi:hypothetical protein
MASPLRLEMDTKAFDGMLVELAAITGKSFKQIIQGETASILGRSIERTKPSTTKVVSRRYQNKAGVKNKYLIPWVTINGVRTKTRSIKHKGVWVNKKFMKNKVNPDWKLMQAELKRLHAIAKSRRGLSKATFVAIARQLGIQGRLKPTVPKYVFKAEAGFGPKVKASFHGKSQERGDSEFVIEVKNFSRAAMSPKAKKGAGGFDAFRKSFNGRISHFEKSMALGVFNSATKIARNYSGWYTAHGDLD